MQVCELPIIAIPILYQPRRSTRPRHQNFLYARHLHQLISYFVSIINGTQHVNVRTSIDGIAHRLAILALVHITDPKAAFRLDITGIICQFGLKLEQYLRSESDAGIFNFQQYLVVAARQAGC